MASRRMFALTIIDSDSFLDMPASARLLYYDLGMRADDDGFVNSPKKILRFTGASEDDLKVLAAKKFIIPFDSGVVVVKHWRINNLIRKDLYTETKYKEEKSTLYLDENNAYSLHPPDRLTVKNRNETDTEASQNRTESGTSTLTQVSIGKNRLEQYSSSSVIDLLTDEEYESLLSQVKNVSELLERLETIDPSTVKKPYSYCLKVAKEVGLI